MKKIIFICGLILFSACAGESYRASNSERIFKPDVCLNIPVGIEKFQYMDPSVKHLKISCADVARCAAQTGQGVPPNVPCE